MCIPFWNSFSLSNSSYNIAFSFYPVTNLFFRVFTFRIKFPIFRVTIAMVWNNSTALSTFITFATTSSTNFGVLVNVVRSLDPSIDDPSSYTILLPSWNSNGNPFADFGLLGGICRSIGLNSSKIGCVATFTIYNSIACRPSCVYYYCAANVVVNVENVLDLQWSPSNLHIHPL